MRVLVEKDNVPTFEVGDIIVFSGYMMVREDYRGWPPMSHCRVVSVSPHGTAIGIEPYGWKPEKYDGESVGFDPYGLSDVGITVKKMGRFP